MGVLGQKKPKNLPPSRTTFVPNFVLICPAIWISIENRHTHIALYVLEDIRSNLSTEVKAYFLLKQSTRLEMASEILRRIFQVTASSLNWARRCTSPTGKIDFYRFCVNVMSFVLKLFRNLWEQTLKTYSAKLNNVYWKQIQHIYQQAFNKFISLVLRTLKQLFAKFPDPRCTATKHRPTFTLICRTPSTSWSTFPLPSTATGRRTPKKFIKT